MRAWLARSDSQESGKFWFFRSKRFQTDKIMSKNPKITIALAFVLTFLIGFGGGYMLCGNLNPHAGSPDYYPALGQAEEDRIAPEPAREPAPESPTNEDVIPSDEEEITAPQRTQRRAEERAVETDQSAEAVGVTETEDTQRQAMRGNGQHRVGDGRRAMTAPEAGDPVPAATDTPYREELPRDDERERDYRTRADERMQEGVEERTGERRFRRMDPDADTSVEQSSDYRFRDRQGRPDPERSPFNRYRIRLIRDLSLTEENAEAFFSILEEHRRLVREEIVIPQRALRERHRELSEQLEAELSGLLSDEQLEVWRERYSPRMDRSQSRPASREDDE